MTRPDCEARVVAPGRRVMAAPRSGDRRHLPAGPATAYGVGVSSLERRRSTLDRLDDGLLVIVALVGVVVLFSVVGWVVHTVVFFVKVALVAVFIGLIVRVVARHR
jgi:hypothetical protein